MSKDPRPSPRLQAFENLWSELFTTPVHLDSAISKSSPKQKSGLAQLLPPLLLRPTTLAEASGVGVAPGEPWTLSQEQLVGWAPARSVAKVFFDGALETRRYPKARVEDFPPAMLAEWERDFGNSITQSLVETLGAEPPLGIRVRHSTPPEKLARELQPTLPVSVKPSTLSPVGVRLGSFAPILSTAAFERGEFEIQDEGSQLMALFALWPELYAPILQEQPGPARWPEGTQLPPVPANAPAWTVIDACAGAGGKTLALADFLSGKGRIYAYDTAPRKLQALRRRAKRADIHNFQAVAMTEGKEEELVARFRRRANVVLVDAPCSGWGVLRRNPDIKWRQPPEALERLPELQKRLLSLYSALVAPGGLLTFGVCTFRKAETRDVVEAFLSKHSDFEKGPGGYLGPGPCDGFFMQSFRRKRG